MAPSLSLEDEIVAAIRKIMRAVDLHSRWLAERYGLTGPQLATLQEVARVGRASAGALARALQLSQPTITGILDRLERRSLIERSRDARDRRTVTVTITLPGRKVLADAPPLLQDRFSRELAKLEQWERTWILATLQRVAAMMGAETIEASPVLIRGPVDADGGGVHPSVAEAERDKETSPD